MPRGAPAARNGTLARHAATARNGRPAVAHLREPDRAPARLGLTGFVDIDVLEQAADAVLIVRQDGTVAHWSAGAERLFGYTSAEIEGRKTSVLFPPDGMEKRMGLLRAQVIEGVGVAPFETQRIAKGGRVVTVRASALPVRSADGEVTAIAILYADVSEQKRVEAELRASEAHYRAVLDSLSEGVVAQDIEGRVISYNRAAKEISGLSDSEMAVATAYESAVKLIGEDGIEIPPEDLPAMVCLRTGEPQRAVVLGIVRPDGETRWISVNSVPFMAPGEPVPHGVVSSFADITEQTRTTRELEGARLEDLRRLALVSEYRDDETSRHTERVARAAQLLALELGTDTEFAWTIARAAPLHDVGKVGIPDRILLKPGKLSAREFEVMMTHTSIGGRILAESDFRIVQMAMEIALTHHERWDGRGYPRGLKGEQIPLSGRIVAVVDAFDAMTHDRPYRKAGTIEDAVAELGRCSGTQFDPRVVRAFLELPYDALVDRD